MGKNTKKLTLAIGSLLLIGGLFIVSFIVQSKHVVTPLPQPSPPRVAQPATVTKPPDQPPVRTERLAELQVASTKAPSTAPRQDAITQTVQKEYVYRALRTANDPLITTSWALDETKAATAWDRTTGTSTIMAVIDTGFALQHEDLKNQWWRNTGEQGMTSPGDACWTGTSVDKATNNCDDDRNGYVDDYSGWSFTKKSNNPQTGTTNPNGTAVAHGTQVAGLVGATGNNGLGIATFNWNARIMPLQVLSDDGEGLTSGVTAAMYYAVDNGASVINMSLGGSEDDPALAAAIDYAYAHKVVVVAAAGNCGTGLELYCDPTKPGAMGYPGLNKHVIAVGATTKANTRASFSSYGSGLDVMAPGAGSIAAPAWSAANPTSLYSSNVYGTSYSSPYVASLVSLIKAVRPNTSVDDIMTLINGTARKLPAMNGQNFHAEYGHGIINAEAVVAVASELSASTNTTKPTLAQTGSYIAEHSFLPNSTMTSQCTVGASLYCTVWAQNLVNGYDRVLPYGRTGTAGYYAWQWPDTMLGSGGWELHARSGELLSPDYMLLSKQ